MVAEIRQKNNIPIPLDAKATRWPKQTGDLKNGLKFDRELTSEELMRVSELYQAELEMVVYKDGRALIRKGPSVGDHTAIDTKKGNVAGRTVGGAFPDRDDIVKLKHTHPSLETGRHKPSVEDMVRSSFVKNLDRSQSTIVTRNRLGQVREYNVFD